MSRYIDAEKLLVELRLADTNAYESYKYERANGITDAIIIVKNAPTADVVEVKHGEWIPCELKDGRDMVNLGYLKCSQCGDFGFLSGNNWGDWTGQTVTTYCPTCGAHMRNG